jgi:hypothetical protein
MPVIASGSTLDPIATLFPDPAADYAGMAAAHHALAEAAALDMQRLAAELLALRKREAKGEAWLREPQIPGAAYDTALLLLRAIGDDIQAVSLELSQAERTCWNACRNAWVAEKLQEKSRSASGNAPYVNVKGSPREVRAENVVQHTRSSASILEPHSTHSPLDLWQALVGEWQAPGSWPPNDEEMYVPERWQVGGWETEELEALVARKRR